MRPLACNLREARCTRLERAQHHAAAAELDVASDVLQIGAAERQRVDTEPDLGRDRRSDDPLGRRNQRRQRIARRQLGAIGAAEQPVGIERARREHGIEPRPRAEFRFRGAVAASARARPGRSWYSTCSNKADGRIGLHPRADAPGLGDIALVALDRHAARHGRGPLEPGRAIAGGQQALDLGKDRPVGGIDR